MKKIFIVTFIIVLMISCSVINFQSADKDLVYRIPTVNNNVCKTLRGHVILYAIFVDSKETKPWTEYDIFSAMDSVNSAINWIEEQALQDSIFLNIDLVCHENEGVIPIDNKLARKNLTPTLFGQSSASGIKSVDKWADMIAKTAAKSLGPDTSKITRTKIQPLDRDKLVARLRDIYKTDNVALMYFINNYYTDEVSVALHTAEDYNIEYAVVSFKNTPVIAHEFLHLFGALDLYIAPWDKDRQGRKKKKFAMQEFPNEIMAFPYRKIEKLEISPFTKYLIGWQDKMDDRYKDMILGKKINVESY
ncbi:MAG: hypothetical protein JXB00_02400 [Bacteroidales bacterium]|nr:hypothetical protein [Bacteroidales bacterium]